MTGVIFFLSVLCTAAQHGEGVPASFAGAAVQRAQERTSIAVFRLTKLLPRAAHRHVVSPAAHLPFVDQADFDACRPAPRPERTHPSAPPLLHAHPIRAPAA